MAVFTVTCPDCGSVLRRKSPAPAGRRIKCPACATVFPVPPVAEPGALEAISDKPLPPPLVARRRACVVEAKEDDEEGLEERPRKSESAWEKKHPGGGTWLLVGGLAVGLLVVLGCGGGVGAYLLWFSSGTNRGTGNEDPLAYVPPRANLVMGIDYAALLNDPVLGPRLEASLRQQGGNAGFFEEVKKQAGLEFKDLFAHTVIGMDVDFDQGGNPFWGGGLPGAPAAPGLRAAVTLILRPTRPFNQRKVAQSSKNAARRSYHGKTYYEISDAGFRTLFMPSDHTIVLSNLEVTQMGPLFEAGGTQPNVSAGVAAMIRGVENNTFWLAVPLEGEVRRNLDDALFHNPPPADFKPLVDAVAPTTCAALWGNLEGNRVKMGLGVGFPEAPIAAHASEVAKQVWLKRNARMKNLGIMWGLLPKTSQVYREWTGSLQFAAPGTIAEVTGETSRQSLGEAVAELQKLAANRAAGADRGGPGFGR